MKMAVNKKNEVTYYTFPRLDEYSFIKHGYSSRYGGTSRGIYESMNLGFNLGDENKNVLKNYELFAKALGINCNNMVLSSQCHETRIRKVNANDRGKGIIRERDYECVDGLVTDENKIALVTVYADCVPLFFFDPVKKIIGLAHAGWRGTVKNIAAKMVEVFVSDYSSEKADIIAGIGPSIGVCCFETGEDVRNEIERNDKDNLKFMHYRSNGKYMTDLWKINEANLVKTGIQHNNITISQICTACNKDTFFSHRGHRGKRGSQAAVIYMES